MYEMVAIVLGIFSFVTFVVAMFGTGIYFGYTFLKPIIKASQGKEASGRLYTSDFFSLTMVLVLPTMLMTTFRRSSYPIVVPIVIGVLVYTITIWMWGRGAIKLSSIGVSSSLKRFLFLGVILPIAILGTAIGVPGLCVGLVACLARFSLPYVISILSGFLAAALVAYGGQLACKWVLIPDQQLDEGTEVEESSTD